MAACIDILKRAVQYKFPNFIGNFHLFFCKVFVLYIAVTVKSMNNEINKKKTHKMYAIPRNVN